jgi:hypothetical protein
VYSASISEIGISEAMETRPQFYKNTLKPIDINQENLQHVLEELQAAVKNGTEVICQSCPSLQPSQYGNIYGETPGTRSQPSHMSITL